MLCVNVHVAAGGRLPADPLPAPEPCLRLLKFILEKQIQGNHAVFQSQ